MIGNIRNRLKKSIVTVTMNPVLDRTLNVKNFRAGGTFQVDRSESFAGGKGVNVSRALRAFGIDSTATGMLADALKPVKDEFLRGTRIVTGHTLLKNTIGIGFLSPETEERFSGDLDARNSFFEKVGSFKPADDSYGGKELAQSIGKMWDEALK